MRRIIILLALAGGVAGCQARETRPEDRATAAKPVDVDDAFSQTRMSFERTMRERLARLSRRIDQLETRADAAGHDAAVKLRARRDDLQARMRQAADQTEQRWDRFERDFDASIDQLEHDIDQFVE